MSYGEASYGEAAYGAEAGPGGPVIISQTLSEILSLPDTPSPLQILVPSLVEALVAADVLDSDQVTIIGESLVLADVNTGDFVRTLVDRFIFQEALAQDAILLRTFQDALRLNDGVYRAFADLIQDALAFADTPTFVKYWVQTLRDRLALADITAADSTYNALVASALAFADLAAHWEYETLTDSLAINDAIVGSGRVYKTIVDSILAGDTSSYLAAFVLNVTDSVDFADSASQQAIYQSLLEDELSFVLWDGNDQTAYSGFVMNPLVGGLTEYKNFNFNSIAKIGASYYAASNTGLYLLEGSDDAGTAIDLRVKLGAFDFGYGYKTRVTQAYIGVRSDGKIVVKVIADDGKERWYETQALHSDLNTQRAKLGKGISSRYWQFEIVNRSGSDMELEQIEFLPIVLTRRV